METSSLLLAISQLALGLAGFSAIIVTLNPRPVKEWDLTDRLNLRLLVQVSFVALVFSLLPFLLSITLSDDQVWLYGLWLYGVLHLLDVSTFVFKMTPETPTVFRITGYIGIVIALIQVLTAWRGETSQRELAYAATLVYHLYVVFMAFVLLLYQLRKST
jgi:hypothetical protein